MFDQQMYPKPLSEAIQKAHTGLQEYQNFCNMLSAARHSTGKLKKILLFVQFFRNPCMANPAGMEVAMYSKKVISDCNIHICIFLGILG